MTAADVGVERSVASQRARPASGVLVFFVLAYAISWAWEIPLAVTGHTVLDGHGWPTHLPSLIGPLAAALLLIGWNARAGELRNFGSRMVLWRIGWRWWVGALSPLPVLLVTIPVLAAAGVAPPAGDFARYSGLSAGLGVVGVWLLVILINGFGEEAGWRGYALPRLQQRFGPVTATVLLSVGWALWHLPQFSLLHSFRGFSPAMIPVWLYGLFAGAVVMSWLYNRTGGSILAVAVFHGMYNLTGGTQAASDHAGVLSVVMWAFVVVLATALLRAERHARRSGQPSVIGRREQPSDDEPDSDSRRRTRADVRVDHPRSRC